MFKLVISKSNSFGFQNGQSSRIVYYQESVELKLFNELIWANTLVRYNNLNVRYL